MFIEFTLFYSGPLRANSDPAHKQKIRRAFHPQLKKLWNQEPLCHFKKELDINAPVSETIICKRSGFKFAPLVNTDFHLVVELEITMLRPEMQGSIITQGGDIDNRLKTLFDSLQVPKEGAIPKIDKPKNSEEPFFCLLEDDHLITKVTVNTAQLLNTNLIEKGVILFIKVDAKKIATFLGGMELP